MSHRLWIEIMAWAVIIVVALLLLRWGLSWIFDANEAGRHLQAKHDAALAENNTDQPAD